MHVLSWAMKQLKLGISMAAGMLGEADNISLIWVKRGVVWARRELIYARRGLLWLYGSGDSWYWPGEGII